MSTYFILTDDPTKLKRRLPNFFVSISGSTIVELVKDNELWISLDRDAILIGHKQLSIDRCIHYLKQVTSSGLYNVTCHGSIDSRNKIDLGSKRLGVICVGTLGDLEWWKESIDQKPKIIRDEKSFCDLLQRLGDSARKGSEKLPNIRGKADKRKCKASNSGVRHSGGSRKKTSRPGIGWLGEWEDRNDES